MPGVPKLVTKRCHSHCCLPWQVPAEWIESGWRVFVEAVGVDLGAAAVKLNGEYAGGFIGAPFRLEVTDRVQAGTNAITIEPRTPTSVRIVAYP